MNLAALLSLIPFALVMSITPGPNNLMVAASGVNFGFWRSLPHILGVTIGFPVLLLSIGFGLGAVIEGHVVIQLVLKYAGCAYLLYTAYKLAASSKVDDLETPPAPKSFLEAAAFQWINPKAWMMGVSSMATFAAVGADRSTQIIVMVVVLGVMAFGSASIWTVFGALIAERLHDPKALRLFNVSMALALVASLIPILQH